MIKFILGYFLSMFVFAVSSMAAVDTALSTGVTDLGTFWDSIYDLKLLVAIALIGLAWFKKVR